LKNINVNKFDLEFEVDPLFQKTSATFDEGGTGGLLLNHLHCRDDTSEIVLDSNTVIMNIDHHEDAPNTQKQRANKIVKIKELKDLCNTMTRERELICPAFAEFEFSNWNKEDIDETIGTQPLRGANDPPASEHAFDLDAEPEPDAIPLEGASDVMDDAFDDMAVDDDNDDAGSNFGGARDMMLGDGKEVQVLDKAMQNIKQGTVGNLMQFLAADASRSDYSYFNQNAMKTWAGPEHWKIKGRTKEIEEGEVKYKKEKRGKKREFSLDFDEERDFQTNLKKTRASTTLAKSTLEKYSKSRSTLPEDLHYDGDNLFQIFGKPKVMLKRQREGVENVDDDIEDYDYENANDRDNFCPAGDMGDDMDEDNEDPPGFDFTQATDFTQTQEDTLADGTMLQGDNLVAEPKKVAKIDISYAKTAKKMDVKRLKASMWNVLTTSKSDEDKVREENVETSVPTEMPEPVKFQEMVNKLPDNISKGMAKNLSVPIAFVCLLHLANEKSLKITSTDDLSDLVITQDD